MNFFGEHRFATWGSAPEARDEFSKRAIYYGIQYNHAGRFHLRADGGDTVELEGAYAFITHPGTWFEYGVSGPGTRHHNHICSYGLRVEHYVESGLLIPMRSVSDVVKIADPDKFLETMLKIMSLLDKHVPTVPPRAVWLYEDLLLQMDESRQTAANDQFYQYTPLRKLAGEIRRYPEKTWNFAGEARKLSLSDAHFRRCFRAVAGEPPIRYLIRCRLQAAARLLVSTDLSIAEIAVRCGIPDEFYFSRLFKARFEAPPTRYRHSRYPG